MRTCYVIFFVVLCVVVDKAMGQSHQVRAYRIKNKVNAQTSPFLATDIPLKNGQLITWFQDFGAEVLYFAGKVTYDRNGRESTAALLDPDSELDICEELDDGSWDDVVGQILRKSWLPNGACPVKAGNYTVVEPTGPFKITIREQLFSTIYNIEVSVGHAKNILFETKYLFEILK